MPNYYVEGTYINRQGTKKKHKTGTNPVGIIEPYARIIWAENPREALLIAVGELQGGEWTESPRVSLVTEEQRMRDSHQPEFPGFSTPISKKRKH